MGFNRRNKILVRASVADVVKIMLFCHTKSLFYYFTISFYNIPFIRCSIFLLLYLNIISLFFLILVRASVADVVKIMLFCHTKSLLYYFTISFYNIPFIRCSIFLPLYLNIISLFFLILILFFLYYLFNGNILFFLSNFNVPYSY